MQDIYTHIKILNILISIYIKDVVFGFTTLQNKEYFNSPPPYIVSLHIGDHMHDNGTSARFVVLTALYSVFAIHTIQGFYFKFATFEDTAFLAMLPSDP